MPFLEQTCHFQAKHDIFRAKHTIFLTKMPFRFDNGTGKKPQEGYWIAGHTSTLAAWLAAATSDNKSSLGMIIIC